MNIKKFKRIVLSVLGKNYMAEKTELFLAVEEQDVEKVKSLLTTASEKEINLIYDSKLANSNQKIMPAKTAFFQACQLSNPEIIEAFLETGKLDINWKNSDNEIALFRAAKHIPLNTIKKIIDYPNINLHAQNKYNENILHLLAQRTYHPKDIKDSTELIQYLIEKGVDYKQRTKMTESNIFDLAIEHRQENLVKFLLTTDIDREHPHNNDQMYHAIWTDININSNIAKLLIDNGYNINTFIEDLNENEDEIEKHRMMQNKEFIEKKEELLAHAKIHEEKKHLNTIIKEMPSLEEKIKSNRDESNSNSTKKNKI